MPSKDAYVTIAKSFKRELDTAGLGFKSYQANEIQERAREIAGEGAHVLKDEGAKSLGECLRDQGLIVYPKLDDLPEDGYVRILRAGGLLASILINLQTPGKGSDTDLAQLINRIKRRDLDDSGDTL